MPSGTGERVCVWFNFGSIASGSSITQSGKPPRCLGVLCIALAMLGAIRSEAVQGAEQQIAPAAESVSARTLVVTLNKSRTIYFDRPFATAVVGSPDIADALPVTDRGLHILGKKIGTTSVSVYDKNEQLVAVVDLEVAIDAQNLKNKIIVET